MIPVKDIKLDSGITINELVNQFHTSGGFSSRKIGIGAKILKKMVNDTDCVKFLSFPACIVATGTRGIIKDLVKNRMVDVIITTCGTLDHDLARVWKDYFHGSFLMNDKQLHEQGICRLGNVVIPNESYGLILEDKMQKILENLDQDEFSTKELIWEIGKTLETEPKREESIIYWAWKNQIPIFIPGITDGAVGSQLWSYWQQNKNFKINLFKDEQELSDIVWKAKKTGGFIIGGGISKHHTIWWNQFHDGLDYAVYVTTAQEFDGSLSGAKVREAISWGKVSESADFITIDGDATVILPILVSTLFG